MWLAYFFVGSRHVGRKTSLSGELEIYDSSNDCCELWRASRGFELDEGIRTAVYADSIALRLASPSLEEAALPCGKTTWL